MHGALLDEQLQLPEHALAVLGHGLALDALHVGLCGALTRGEAEVGPRAEQLPAERRDVDLRLRCRCVAGGRSCRCGCRGASRLRPRGRAGAVRGCRTGQGGLRGGTGCRVNHRVVLRVRCGLHSHGMGAPRRRRNPAFGPYKRAARRLDSRCGHPTNAGDRRRWDIDNRRQSRKNVLARPDQRRKSTITETAMPKYSAIAPAG